VQDIEAIWSNERLKDPIGSFDSLVRTQLENAQKAGVKTVNVVDIGSGTGNLFVSALKDNSLKDYFIKTKEFLSNNPEFNVRLIGITDPEGIEDVGGKVSTNGVVLVNDSRLTENGRISAVNYSYTIDSTHSLKDFLQQRGIEQTHLLLATRSLMYFRPHAFRRTFDEAAKALYVGGRFIVHGYADGWGAGNELSDDMGIRRTKTGILQRLSDLAEVTAVPPRDQYEGENIRVIRTNLAHLEPILGGYIERFLASELKTHEVDEVVKELVATLETTYKSRMYYLANKTRFDQQSPGTELKNSISYLKDSLRLIHLIKLRRIKAQIIEEFIKLHPNIDVQRGPKKLISMTKIQD
jgi:hypothetical protein